jgi:hypothetical protein
MILSFTQEVVQDVALLKGLSPECTCGVGGERERV